MTPSFEAVAAVVRPHLKFLPAGEALEAERALGTLGLDSMASIDLLLDLERAFGVTIDEEALTENSFNSVAEIRKLVEASQG